MSQAEPKSTEQDQAASGDARNPFIMNFLRVLAEKKGEKLEPEALEKLLSDMYGFFEYLLGQNMINSLPEEARKEYLSQSEDLRGLSYEKIGEVFAKNTPDYERVMKETMKQLADIYMKNRGFNAEE